MSRHPLFLIGAALAVWLALALLHDLAATVLPPLIPALAWLYP